LPQAHHYASGYRPRWFKDHNKFHYYPCNKVSKSLIKVSADWLQEVPFDYEPHSDSDSEPEPQQPNKGSKTHHHKTISKNRRLKNNLKTLNNKKNRSKKTLKIKKQFRNPETNQQSC